MVATIKHKARRTGKFRLSVQFLSIEQTDQESWK